MHHRHHARLKPSSSPPRLSQGKGHESRSVIESAMEDVPRGHGIYRLFFKWQSVRFVWIMLAAVYVETIADQALNQVWRWSNHGVRCLCLAQSARAVLTPLAALARRAGAPRAPAPAALRGVSPAACLCHAHQYSCPCLGLARRPPLVPSAPRLSASFVMHSHPLLAKPRVGQYGKADVAGPTSAFRRPAPWPLPNEPTSARHLTSASAQCLRGHGRPPV